MAPMARTNRNAPANNVDALDNLDLDDMFMADGDALFEGLDLEIGNMEDITGNNNKASTPPGAPAPATSPDTADTAPRRRKTKRKTTAPTFFDDLDDDEPEQEPVRKKKRTSKGAAPKRGGRGKKAATETATTTASAKKSKTNKTVATPAAQTGVAASGAHSTPSGVAAAGQFGGRQKKTVGSKSTAKGKAPKARADPKSRGVLPMAANRGAAAPQAAPVAPSTSTAPPAGTKAKPAQTLFCGLGPSDSVFYPFLPALPSEVALKNRKVYALLDRVHTSFVGSFGHGSGGNPPAVPEGAIPAKEGDPIFKLTQEAYKEEKNSTTHPTAAERSQSIGAAIGAVRKTISLFDKAKLAQDLLAVCALLRRQHDFVKQNNANMERWCRKHFNDEDFAAVYHDGKKKRKGGIQSGALDESGAVQPVLSTFKVPQIKVKLMCTGFKEPKAALVAILPLDQKRAVALKATKRKPETESTPVLGAISPPPAPVVAPPTTSAADLSYSTQAPAKRRKAVGGLLARVAQTLETREHQRIEKRRQIINVQERRRKDVAEDTSVAVIHTAGMWKYMQESGYFDDQVNDADLEERIEWVGAMEMPTGTTRKNSSTCETTESAEAGTRETSLTDRLIGLLVEEGEDSEPDGDEESDDSSIGSDRSAGADTEHLLDLSKLTVDERAEIQLRMIGLIPDDSVADHPDSTGPELNGRKIANGDEKESLPHGSSFSVPSQMGTFKSETASVPSGREQENSIDEVVAAMMEELQQTNALNKMRADFAQRMARSHLETPEGAMRRRQREASALTRGAALLKRNKEAKAKAGKKAKQDDDLKLPW